MMTSKLRVAVILGITLGVIGGVGAGIYHATAADPAKPVAKASNQNIASEAQPSSPDVGLPGAKPDVKAKKSPSELTQDQLITVLHDSEITLEDQNLNDIPLFELLQKLSKRYGVNFVILEEEFMATQVNDIKERKPILSATQVNGLTPHRFLTMILGSMNATYLVKNGHLEIVPISYAEMVSKTPLIPDERGGIFEGRQSLTQPLVTVSFHDKPLKEAVSLIAKRYDLSVVISPQAVEFKPVPVTASLQNVPASTALEVLAELSDLQVVRRGTVFMITSREHAIKMLKDQLEKERVELEIKKLRKPKP